MNAKLDLQASTSTNTTNQAEPNPHHGPRYERPPMNHDVEGPYKTPFRNGDLPLFSGENAQAWLNTVERFFYINAVPEVDKLHLISLHFEGPAQGWFVYTEKQTGFENYLDFKRKFERRYGFSSKVLKEKLFNIHQTHTVSEY